MPSAYPSVFTLPWAPLPSDGVYTDTLLEQRDTEERLSDVLSDVSSALVPREPATMGGTTALRKAEHGIFLHSTFYRLPAPYVALDASRPWLMYWTVHSLDLLGIGLDPGTTERYVGPQLSSLFR